MAFFIDARQLLKHFATEVTVYPQTANADGEWVDGQWQPAAAAEPQTFYEPLIPNDRTTIYTITSLLRDTGKTELYNALWVSEQDFPTGTIVEHNATKYRITDIEDLSSYSNVRLYYLASEEGEQDK